MEGWQEREGGGRVGEREASAGEGEGWAGKGGGRVGEEGGGRAGQQRITEEEF